MTLTPDYTDIGRTIEADNKAESVIKEMLAELASFLDVSRSVVIDGFYDAESGHPAIMAKVRTSIEDARELLTRIDRFQEGPWWVAYGEAAPFDLILSVGA